MPRRPRIEIVGYYHIINRGVGYKGQVNVIVINFVLYSPYLKKGSTHAKTTPHRDSRVLPYHQ